MNSDTTNWACESCGVSLDSRSASVHTCKAAPLSAPTPNHRRFIKHTDDLSEKAEVESSPSPTQSFWWCAACQVKVPSFEVTFEETHDTRCGGCGGRVTVRSGSPSPTPYPDVDVPDDEILVCPKHVVAFTKDSSNCVACNRSEWVKVTPGHVSVPTLTLLAIRDAILRDDLTEAHHLLYGIADPTYTSRNPWKQWELPAPPKENRDE